MDNRVLVEGYDGDLTISNIASDQMFTVTMLVGSKKLSLELDIDQLDEMIKTLIDLQEESD